MIARCVGGAAPSSSRSWPAGARPRAAPARGGAGRASTSGRTSGRPRARAHVRVVAGARSIDYMYSVASRAAVGTHGCTLSYASTSGRGHLESVDVGRHSCCRARSARSRKNDRVDTAIVAPRLQLLLPASANSGVMTLLRLLALALSCVAILRNGVAFNNVSGIVRPPMVRCQPPVRIASTERALSAIVTCRFTSF